MSARSVAHPCHSWLALAVYLLAGIATPFCHNHPVGGPCSGPYCQAHHHDCDVHEHGNCDDHDHALPDEHEHHGLSLAANDAAAHSGHCVACEYSAQPVSAALDTCELSGEKLIDLRQSTVERLQISSVLKSFAARAPPHAV